MGSRPGSNNKGGPPRRKTCQNGHDLAKFGKQMFKTLDDGSKVKNGRVCTACQRTPEAKARNAARNRERYRERMIEQAAREMMGGEQ